MDGSKANFKYAFFVESADQRAVAVFTEHCGYFELAAFELRIETVIREIFTSRYPEVDDDDD
ncbi:MAG: hypothetical protein JSR45_09805 [Proteobacteria bacterium]|nr:hypothetical protein [Pseudomonadota bacterium]